MSRVTQAWRRQASIEIGESIGKWSQQMLEAGRKVDGDDRSAKTEKELTTWVMSFNAVLVRDGMPALTVEEENDVRGFVLASFGELPAAIQQLVDTDNYTDIHVMGVRVMVAERRDGQRERHPSPFNSIDELMQTVRRWASTGTNREFSDSSPILDMVLGNRIRVAATFGISDEPSFSLRISSESFRTLEQLRQTGMFNGAVEAVLRAAMRSGESIIVCGATGSGKTTVINALLASLPVDRRVVVIEDEREIWFDLNKHFNVEFMSARPANMAGEGEISMERLVRHSLRRRPDYVVVGECRGPEAFQLVKVSTQGNSVLSSIHANSPADMVDRLSLFMAEASMQLSPTYIAKLIGKGVQLVIYVDVVDGRRVISDIVEVTGAVDTSLSTVPWFSGDDRGNARLNIATRSALMTRLFDNGLDPELVSGGSVFA
jgi:pilus assembly protein CpaF